MKFLQLAYVSVIFAFAGAAMAQSTANPDNTSAQAAQATTASTEPVPSSSPAIPVEPPSLIPPNSLPGPGTASLPPSQLAPDLQLLNALFRQTSLGKVADEHLLHVQMAELEIQFRNDPELHQLKTEAQQARTDLEKRHILKAYYHLYFKKLSARATTPELKTYLNTQEALHQYSLLQPRVRHQTDETVAADLLKEVADAATPAVEPGASGTQPTPTPPPVYDDQIPQ